MPYPSKTDRETILATAMDLVSRNGVNAVAIRSIATALNLAPNALYRYFSNLAALHDALAAESRRRLHHELQAVVEDKSPEEAIRGIARAYVQFARTQPNVFALTLMPSSAQEEDDAAHAQMWSFVLGHVAQIYGEQRAPEAAVTIWAFLHGMTVLESAQVFGEEKPTSSFEFGLRMWISGAELQAT